MSARWLALGIVTAAWVAVSGPVSVVPTAGATPLPDGRVFEMVTPVQNEDADVYVPQSHSSYSTHDAENARGETDEGTSISVTPTELPLEAAAYGDAVTYPGDATAGGNGTVGNGQGIQYLARRSAAGGWTQINVQPPRDPTPVFQAFSSDLSVGFLSSSEPLSSEAPGGEYSDLYVDPFDGVYQPFSTIRPAHREGYEFEGGPSLYIGEPAIIYTGSSSDLGHLLFEANDALTPSAADGGAQQDNLYDSVGGQTQLVNVLPDGSTNANATFGGPPIPDGKATKPDFSHVISADGSRIFWTDLNTHTLYVRENDTQPQSSLGTKGECIVSTDACTVQVDASQGPEQGGDGQFWTASSAGSKVFFTDCRRLTSDSTAAFSAGCDEANLREVDGQFVQKMVGNDLYEYDVEGGRLTDLTVDDSALDEFGADVQGVVGASEDGEYVYFVAEGVLAGGPSRGQPNLYVRHDGLTTFIATLSPEDDHPGAQWASGDWEPGLGTRTAEVTPDGHSIVFMSRASLTGYPNEGLNEVFVYDDDTGRLSCASCDPSGSPPSIVRNNTAAFLPVSWSNTYQPRWISEDGSRVFFDSSEPLVPQDSNEEQDVYEWERAGTNGCRRPYGCVYLLSGGTGTDESYLLDASANGNDVFIITRTQLAPQDRNEDFNVFDARVDGLSALAPPACSGTGCQGLPGTPPVFATPSSVTFNGVGNFVAFPRGAVHGKRNPKHKGKAKSKRHKPKRKGARKANRHGRKRGKAGRS